MTDRDRALSKAVDAQVDAALDRFRGDNFDDLDEVDRVLVTLWGIETEVANGGFDQFYFNVAGDVAFFAPTALRLIGASRMAEIAAQANALFGPQGPSRSRDERWQQLMAIPRGDRDPWDPLTREFGGYPDDVGELLERFLRERGRL